MQMQTQKKNFKKCSKSQEIRLPITDTPTCQLWLIIVPSESLPYQCFCFGILLDSDSADTDRKHGGQEWTTSCKRDPQLEVNQGHCSYMMNTRLRSNCDLTTIGCTLSISLPLDKLMQMRVSRATVHLAYSCL